MSAIILNVVVQGVLTGLVYGLMALGLSVIFGIVRVVNFAHGEFAVVAMYAAYLLFRDFGLGLCRLLLALQRRDLLLQCIDFGLHLLTQRIDLRLRGTTGREGGHSYRKCQARGRAR